MKFIPVVCLVLCTLAVSAQGPRVAFRFSPLALVDEPSFPTIQGGIEYSISSRFSWFNEFGWKYRRSYYETADTTWHPNRGFKLKSELRFYLGDAPRRMEGPYLALNAFFTKDHHTTSIIYFFQGDSSKRRYDDFGVIKTVSGANLVFGIQRRYRKHQLVETYAGLGIRVRDVFTSNREFDNDRDHLIGWHHPNLHVNRNRVDATTGKTVLLNLTVGLRIGWK